MHSCSGKQTKKELYYLQLAVSCNKLEPLQFRRCNHTTMLLYFDLDAYPLQKKGVPGVCARGVSSEMYRTSSLQGSTRYVSRTHPFVPNCGTLLISWDSMCTQFVVADTCPTFAITVTFCGYASLPDCIPTWERVSEDPPPPRAAVPAI